MALNRKAIGIYSMKIFGKRKLVSEINDVDLVLLSLGGDRDAFCEIVSRYQNLLCSLAYSAVRDIKHSEDIAQESFIEAWKKLDTLKDPEKLKSWLCGILRFKVSRYFRKQDNKPTENVDILDNHTADNEHLEDATIKEQEHALLWQTLEKMDETYREPLILFYREQQSVERVASVLDLSLDTTKQRLSRGRKMLKAAMTTLVEDTLKNSKPGIGFTSAVLFAINGIAPPAKAAAIAGSATKASSVFKLTSIIIFLASISGLISAFFGVKASLKQSRTPQERLLVIKVTVAFFLAVIIYIIGMFSLKHFALSTGNHAVLYALSTQLLVILFVISYLYLAYRMLTKTKELRAKERIFNPQAFHRESDQKNSKHREYKSRIKILGVPLFHFQFGTPEKDDKAAVGWIAGGSTAYGLVFAWGGVATAPISVGIISFGIISIGAVGFGLLGLGTIGIGVIGFGASAIGYKAYGSLSALGWESAFSGGFAMAKEAAMAPIAFAEHVNNEYASSIINLNLLEHSYQWVLGFMTILVIVPAVWHSRKVQQRMK